MDFLLRVASSEAAKQIAPSASDPGARRIREEVDAKVDDDKGSDAEDTPDSDKLPITPNEPEKEPEVQEDVKPPESDEPKKPENNTVTPKKPEPVPEPPKKPNVTVEPTPPPKPVV